MNVRHVLLLILGLLIFGRTSAQVKTSDPLKNAKVFYFKNSGEVVFIKDSADYIRVILPPDSSDLNLYVVNDFYMNGKPKLVGKSLIPYPYLKKQGAFIEYFPNGHRKTITNYNNGSTEGDIIHYYPNGKLYFTEKYDRDLKQTVIHECSDSTGKVLAENGKGNCVQYDDKFKLLTAEGLIVDGLRDGEWHGNANDSVRYICTYKKGVSISGTSYEKSGKEHHFTTPEIEPHFKGGLDAYYAFLTHTIHYPTVAKQNNVQGKVYITFAVNKDGSLSDFKIIRPLGSGCDEEVMRVMKLCPPWEPGVMYGIPVRVQYTVPISFALQFDSK